jgi:hypothetical protein
MIASLDDLSRVFYRKLKADADDLARVRSEIKYKKQLIVARAEQWVELTEQGLTVEADGVYLSKHVIEIELQFLERMEKTLLKRITKYVTPSKT